MGIDQIPNAGGVPAQILVSNSQFNCSGQAINFQTEVLGTSVSNSLFLLQSSSSFALTASVVQTGLSFYGNTVNGEGNLGIGVSFAGAVVGGHIFHNTFNAINTAITTVAGAVYSLSIDKNYFTGGAAGYDIPPGSFGIVIDDTNNLRTVATLPAASTSISGSQAIVTDALSPTYAGNVVGGGSQTVHVTVNGSVWTTQ